ncbi:MAG: hypothetical protein H6946_09990 [Thauera sp.]|jgi:hypothetical protein|nr:hypothetical protein [Thauera sp.]MCP5225436.1 hypothetical protein [Thauera sp.]
MWCSDPPHRRRRIGRVLILLVALSFGQAARAQGVVLVSARAGGIPELDRETAAQLYLGRRTSLPDGRSARLLDLPAGPERDLFYERLTAKNPSQIRAYWSRMVFTGRAHPPHEANDQEDALRRVLTDPSALAYLPAASVVGQPLNVLLRLE